MLLKAPRSTVALLVASAVVSAAPAGAQPSDRTRVPKLDVELSRSVRHGESGFRRVIIRTTPDRIPLMTAVLTEHGHAVRKFHPIVNGVAATVPVAALEGLSRLPFVASISQDAVVTAARLLTPCARRWACPGRPLPARRKQASTSASRSLTPAYKR